MTQNLEPEQSGLREKIDICVADFSRESGYPNKVIANSHLLTALVDEKLVKNTTDFRETMAANQTGDTYLGYNLISREIEIHGIENLPLKVAKQVRERTEKMRLPLILCKTSLFGKFRDITAYELGISTAELTQALAY